MKCSCLCLQLTDCCELASAVLCNRFVGPFFTTMLKDVVWHASQWNSWKCSFEDVIYPPPHVLWVSGRVKIGRMEQGFSFRAWAVSSQEMAINKWLTFNLSPHPNRVISRDIHNFSINFLKILRKNWKRSTREMTEWWSGKESLRQSVAEVKRKVDQRTQGSEWWGL